jgi:hypothetical protein
MRERTGTPKVGIPSKRFEHFIAVGMFVNSKRSQALQRTNVEAARDDFPAPGMR